MEKEVSGAEVLRLERIVKEFPGVKALDNVTFDLQAGEVHVLLGENGAGKSTLMKVLVGVYHPEAGQILLKGQKVRMENPRQAQKQGIAIIYQEFNLVPYLTVAQNIFLGREPRTRLGLVNQSRLQSESRRVLDFLKIDLDVNAPVYTLGVAQQQLVEVAKALSLEADILVMDEPTATLSEHEIGQLFATIKTLKAHGVSIIYISHRLQEIKIIGDRVTVLRDGRTVGTRFVAETELETLIQMMVGREIVKKRMRKTCTALPEEALRVSHLNRGKILRDINLTVRQGEIVGLAGLVGSGRTELARAIYGIDRIDSGEIQIMGKRIHHPSPKQCIRQEMGFLPENRKEDGLALILPLKDNIIQASLRKLFPSGILNLTRERDIAKHYVRELAMAAPDVARMAKFLSGGTQQKVVLAKWLCTQSKMLIFDEPTRGIDVGAKDEIHSLMNGLAAKGVGILMISSELPEILTLSDRIYVMREGAIVQELGASVTTQEEIIGFAAGERAVA
jgi:ribose transport system ATP-binding protein